MKRNILALAMVLISMGSLAENRVMGIINGTDTAMVGLFASNIGRNSWEENILAGDVIMPGQVRYVNFYDGTRSCLFDFMAVMANGANVIRSRVDVCNSTYWTLY